MSIGIQVGHSSSPHSQEPKFSHSVFTIPLVLVIALLFWIVSVNRLFPYTAALIFTAFVFRQINEIKLFKSKS